MSADLIWLLVKNNNAFLVKRGRTNRQGAVQFSKEPGNLLNVNSFKYSGIATDRPVILASGDKEVSLTTKDEKLKNKPAKASSTSALKLSVKAALETLRSSACSASYRPDLTSAAVARYRRLRRDVRVKRGLEKPTKLRTGRKSLK